MQAIGLLIGWVYAATAVAIAVAGILAGLTWPVWLAVWVWG